MNARKSRFLHVAFILIIALASYALLMRNAEIALLPQVWLLHWLYGLRFSGWSEIGYICEGYGFAITPGCMGAKLFIAAFLIMSLGYIDILQNPLKRIRITAIYYIGALVGVLVLNVLRISLSLPFIGLENGQLIHNLISLIMYFGELMLLYLFMQRRKNHDPQRTFR